MIFLRKWTTKILLSQNLETQPRSDRSDQPHVQGLRTQMKTLNDIYPELRSKLTGEYIKLYSDTDVERRELIHKLELKYRYFAIKPKAERPIKVVIRDYPEIPTPKTYKMTYWN
ncbi:hypothetical protein TNCV_4560841 [Trichonephila clavipes]|nr:hypothetical protein TNCV_4560841 [Trichonephila clavipes]